MSAGSAAEVHASARHLLIILLALALTLPVAAPGVLASESAPPDEPPDRYIPPLVVSFTSGPDGGLPLVVEGRTTDLWAAVTWRGEGSLETTLHLEAYPGDALLNRTRVPVDVPSQGTVTFPLQVRNATGTQIDVRAMAANTTGPDGREIEHVANVPVVPPLSVSLEALAPERSRENMHVGVGETVRLRLTTTNPTSTATAAQELQVTGRESHQAIFDPVEVPSLEAGASHTVDLDPVAVRDLMEQFPGRDGRFHGGIHTVLTVAFGNGEGEALRPAHGFTLDGTRVHDVRRAALDLTVHAQPSSYVTGQRIAPGEPSWIEVTVGNFGDAAQTVVVDTSVRPDPAVYYGPGSFFEATRVLRLDAAERRAVNFTFVPTMAGPLMVETQTSFQGHRSVSGTHLELPGAILLETSSATLEPAVGGSVDWSFNLTAVRELGDVELRFAVAPLGHRASQGVSLVRFVTADDLVTITSEPHRMTLLNGTTVHVEAEVTAKAAGSYTVVPFVAKDGVFYPAGSSGSTLEGGERAVRVLSEAELPGASMPWLPVGLVLVAAVGQVVWRRRFVR